MEYKKMSDIELEMMAEESARMLPFQIQMMKDSSKVLAARLNALIEEGFTREEAVEIIKERGTL